QFVLDPSTLHEDLPMMLRVAENTRCPISFSITQNDKAPQRWRQTLDSINEASGRGLSITAQIAARPVAAARTGIVPQPVPDPSQLPGHCRTAAGGTADAAAPARSARGHPERDRDLDRRSAVLPAGLRAAAGKRPGCASTPAGTTAGSAGL